MKVDTLTQRYLNMPLIAPIGERIEKYLPVSESSRGPAIEPKKATVSRNLERSVYDYRQCIPIDVYGAWNWRHCG